MFSYTMDFRIELDWFRSCSPINIFGLTQVIDFSFHHIGRLAKIDSVSELEVG